MRVFTSYGRTSGSSASPWAKEPLRVCARWAGKACVHLPRPVSFYCICIADIRLSKSARVPGTLDQIISTSPESKIYTQLVRQHDPRYGGFANGGSRSRGPKFPNCSSTLEPLARLAAFPPSEDFAGGSDGQVQRISREMAVKMLRGIWEGGVRDWVGGGVARYSVDEKWVVPHFEKML